MTFLERLSKHEWRITVPMFLILLAGIVTLYSTGIGASSSGLLAANSALSNQIAFIVLGLVFYVGLMFFDFEYLKYLPVQILLAVATVFPLLGVLFLGVTRNSATRWFDIGFATIQPSEFAKIFLIVIFAFILTQVKKYPDWLRGIVAMAAGAFVALLIFIEPNLSTALIVMGLCALMFLVYTKDQIFWLLSFVNVAVYTLILLGTIYLSLIPALFINIAGTRIDLLLFGMYMGANFIFVMAVSKFKVYAIASFVLTVLLVITVAVGSTILLSTLHGYQKQRLEAFFNSSKTNSNQIFQINQGKIAIGSGGLFGKGFGQGTQSKLNFIPEQKTDFIFAVFAEEFGWAGSMLLLGAYMVLILSVLSVAIKTKDQFAFIICIGIAMMFLIELFINICVNIQLLPATGVVLPLMSMGGSSMWSKLIALGLVQSIAIHSNSQKKFVIDVESLS